MFWKLGHEYIFLAVPIQPNRLGYLKFLVHLNGTPMNIVALVTWKILVPWIMQRLSGFLIQQQKATFIKITTILSQEKRSFKNVRKWSHSGRHGISKIFISLESFYLIIGNRTDSCFPWSNRLLLFIFEKKSAKQPSLNHSLSDISNKNGVPWKRMPAGFQNLFKCFSFRDDHWT